MAAKTISFYGGAAVGKKTLIGNLIYKCGGLDMWEMEQLGRAGLKEYRTIAQFFSSQERDCCFYTPKSLWTVADSIKNPSVLVYVIDASSGGSLNSSMDTLVELLAPKEARSVEKLIVAINKMDAAGWSEQVYTEITEKLLDRLGKIDLDQTRAYMIPVSASLGDNLLENSSRLPWFSSVIQLGAEAGSPKLATLVEVMDAR
ncbi:hypothetical protein GQ53DRAFT_740551 [Thozetella sp. PMI_491]|nr:hypothetical protein GQ53DRAFT_740551 [Thozetella sp. PMI_491]